MKRILLMMGLLLGISSSWAQQNKVPLSHSDYDGWKNLKQQQISPDGNWVSYQVDPQKGDGWLYVYNVKEEQLDSVSRGYNASFSPDSKFLTFQIKVQHDTTRKAKLDKVKKEKMPKDSLGIWNLATKSIEKVARVKSYRVGKEESSWLAYLMEKEEVKKDTLSKEEKKEKKKEEKGTDLIILNPETGKNFRYKHVTDYTIARNGLAFAFITQEGDSITRANVNWFDTTKEELRTIFSKKGTAKKVRLSAKADQLAFIHSIDTAKTKVFCLYAIKKKETEPVLIVDTLTPAIQEDWTVSENGKLFFSRNGEKLYFGVAPKPVVEPKDTLLEEEKYHVDVWNWKDPLLQPQQKKEAEKERKRSYLAVYHTENGKVVQLGSKEVREVKAFDHGNANLALGSSSLPYQQLESWDDWYKDFYIVNVETGKKELILNKKNSRVSISPAQKYLYWYDTQDSTWYAYDVKARTELALTKEINQKFYNEIHDTPSDASPYGLVGWTKDDRFALIKDRYDIWKIDPTSKRRPQNITNGYGRKNKIRFDYVKMDPEERFVPTKKPIMLKAFHEFNKKSGFFTLKQDGNSEPQMLMLDDVRYYTPVKAKEADRLIWKKSTFKEYPNLWISQLDFSEAKKISNANPQQKNFWWGDVELVKWTSGDGEELQGMLYKPENFDPNKKYPMLVYFYERVTDRLHNHHVPQPNWSIINPSYCVSNGYIVFMPDITYPKVGYPGESAYSSIVTGTLAMLDRYDFIDKENVALQGQSWGGYQIAYLVTRTNLYKCAMSGAPVSNMTSAYGGIRWSTGRSRMFQYEHTQSRIGGTLWNSTLQYIENSPIFFAPKIETPLLIMHNDADGAVPWYQGIELFVAMRRLQKPCWMLTYNEEAHNLRKRPNRMDLSIRTMQFFDYYLKGAAAPAWMVDGIPAVKRGKYDGYELKEEKK
ncbi:MAG: prolyl oligopeptidase family serine peptidase [Marinifilaceae bacterium]